MAWTPRRGTPHALGDRASGPSAAADDLRPGVHRTAGQNQPRPPCGTDVPYAVRSPDGGSSREFGLRDHGAAGRLPRPRVGPARGGVGHSGQEAERPEPEAYGLAQAQSLTPGAMSTAW